MSQAVKFGLCKEQFAPPPTHTHIRWPVTFCADFPEIRTAESSTAGEHGSLQKVNTRPVQRSNCDHLSNSHLEGGINALLCLYAPACLE